MRAVHVTEIEVIAQARPGRLANQLQCNVVLRREAALARRNQNGAVDQRYESGGDSTSHCPATLTAAAAGSIGP
jgi:hypothetical protein